MSEINSHILNDETREKLKCLVNFDPAQTYKFYPLKPGQIEKEFEPWFELKLLNELELLKMSGYVRRYNFLPDTEFRDFLDITRKHVVNWGNIVQRDGGDFVHLSSSDNTSEKQWSEINVVLKVKIAKHLCQISGLTEPEELALKL